MDAQAEMTSDDRSSSPIGFVLLLSCVTAGMGWMCIAALVALELQLSIFWIVTIITAVFGGLITAWSLRIDEEEHTLRANPFTSAIAAAGLLGSIAGAGIFFIALGEDRHTFASAFAVVGAVFIGLPLGALAGLVLALTLVPLLSLAQRLAAQGALESLDIASRRCGLWLVLVSGATLAITLRILGIRPPETSEEWGGLAVYIATISVGLFLAIVGEIRRRYRRHWLDKVRAGSIEGWAIVPAEEIDEAIREALFPLLVHGLYKDLDAVLVRLKPVGGKGAYRSQALYVPWAIVSSGINRDNALDLRRARE